MNQLSALSADATPFQPNLSSIYLLENLHLSSDTTDNIVKKKRNKHKKNIPSAPNEVQKVMTSSHTDKCEYVNPFLKAIEKAGNASRKPDAHEISRNPALLLMINHETISFTNKVVHYEEIPMTSQKFLEVKSLFPPSLTVVHIKKIHNPYLEISFCLTRHLRYSGIQPVELFHGTKLKYVHSICTYNFDWRYNGAERGHLFGKGVNFTRRPKFASNFCEKESAFQILILSDVLIMKKGIGNNELQLPPEGCDTAIRPDGVTFVKFSDAEFCPRYVIFFSKKYSRNITSL